MAYSENDISSMKQEAIRRVREMQKRSQSVLQGHSESAEKQEQQKPQTTNGEIGSLLSSILSGKSKSDGKSIDIAGVSIDEEKALVGILIYILYKQGADIKLLLGLGYLLL